MGVGIGADEKEERIKKQNEGKDERKRGKEEGEGKTEKGKKQEEGRLMAQGRRKNKKE